MNKDNNKNLLLATTLSVIIMISWAWFYEKPRMEKISMQNNLQEKPSSTQLESNNKTDSTPNSSTGLNKISEEEKTPISLKTRQEIIEDENNERIKISSNSLHGSINLRGARFDDLTLAKYFVKIDKKEEVVLFSPAQSKDRYFVDFGFASSNLNLELPKNDTLWQADSNNLTPENPVTLSWTNSQNIEFKIKISLDENYLFTVVQSVKNNSAQAISIANYGRINRSILNLNKSAYILHEGLIGAFNGILNETTYEKILEENNLKFTDNGGSGSWLGITDKYWLSSIIPDKKISFEANFSHQLKNQNHLYNVDFIGQELAINQGEEISIEQHLFAGAKKVKILDSYNKELNLKLFDRAIDFGWFYFLTKPFFFVIEFLYKIFGNFGLAILGMTVIVKLALFPMANKSYEAIAKMKKLQPQMQKIREKFKDDKMALNREMMELYKKEKINPASGCLPIIIQIPVFFALYKVFYVTLDMRHAEFFGWIRDLSAPDPTTILNLFGLLPFEVSTTFTLGIWPILMGATMIIQQRLSPPPADPTQAKVLKYMPYGLTIVLATFPAGLVIYWTWSNALSIVQQIYINKKFKK
ncbi:MAG: membrane protein insertase YidC [Rickettsiales bacterium]